MSGRARLLRGVALAAWALGLAPGAAAQAAAGAATAAGAVRDTATFASGCFWCTESDFEKVPGVLDAVSGYSGGRVADPTYEQVSTGRTGHREAVQVIYDPARVSYRQLLDVFWRNVDPVDARGQFCDKGYQYTSAIYVSSAEERRLADSSKRALDQSGRLTKPVVTEVAAEAPFYKAEDYHQSYYKKNPIRYRYYRTSCGRDRRLRELRSGT
ncbi:MAG: Peptide-methionine (S)-S-oxide reductase MsrA [uncultured Gemmatimonadaceae bacterium]|uniref:Peptide methionine sulfoxide reductase MsrA n=1 Tax=uncultured Gemmatimonadaceae bacterium TaxID=246130 RepID=A0A6J4LEP5_9BACT|nr:MAG: Peptide-methionine (S)-S-oxide reductase MsrA [uncultured Gemmatimonadaceae bacterium]